MSRKSDRALGMGRAITRRDFLHDGSLAALGLTVPVGVLAGSGDPRDGGRYYPPTKTGLRGSHPGTWEVPHALALEGRSFDAAEATGETYDLVVVGGGISGLATALYYQDRFGQDARILILENHDDFGGHAKRNEFHQAGEMRLAIGGVHNLEYTDFSANANAMLKRLGIDVEDLRAATGFNYGEEGFGEAAMFFDRERFGRDVLVKGVTLYGVDLINNVGAVRQMPLSDAARGRLERFVTLDTHVMPELSWEDTEAALRQMSYFDFLTRHGGLDDECLALFNNFSHEIAGQSLVNYSAREALWIGLPGWNLLGEGLDNTNDWDYRFAMFPDGNASIARLMVRALIPDVSPGANARNISLAEFDYDQLDRPANPVRLRLNATAVRVGNTPGGVAVNYVQDGTVRSVSARHGVLACYHVLIPHLCPDMPEAQRAAQKYQVKCPMLITNVLLRNSVAWDAAGISMTWCPGRMHTNLVRLQGNTAGGYAQGSWDRREGPVTLAFFGSIEEPPGLATLKDRLRASRTKMLALEFEDYEREVRTVLDSLLGPHGLDVKRDVLAITVNRWPHGYSYFYRDLWDPAFEDGQYPHEIASKPFGNIAIANADRVASAYTHTAIDVARDAVAELPGP